MIVAPDTAGCVRWAAHATADAFQASAQDEAIRLWLFAGMYPHLPASVALRMAACGRDHEAALRALYSWAAANGHDRRLFLVSDPPTGADTAYHLTLTGGADPDIPREQDGALVVTSRGAIPLRSLPFDPVYLGA